MMNYLKELRHFWNTWNLYRRVSRDYVALKPAWDQQKSEGMAHVFNTPLGKNFLDTLKYTSFEKDRQATLFPIQRAGEAAVEARGFRECIALITILSVPVPIDAEKTKSDDQKVADWLETLTP